MARVKMMQDQWPLHQVRIFVQNAKGRIGDRHAWDFVGPGVRDMAIDAEVLRIFLAQVPGARFGPEDMRALRADMRREAFGEEP